MDKSFMCKRACRASCRIYLEVEKKTSKNRFTAKNKYLWGFDDRQEALKTWNEHMSP